MTKPPNEPIAIIGSACRFSGGADSPSALWELLTKPRDTRCEIPNARFSAKGYYHRNPMQPGHTNVTHSYFLEADVSAFDAEFFGIKPVEAKAIDPQQRWLMETVYEGLEAAGLSIESLRGTNTGVYVGVMCNDYGSILLRDLETVPTYFATGTASSILSNRISHFFDWLGPSMTIETACSSSLVAVHLAVQALRSGEARIAVACGSNLILGPEGYIVESKLRMLSPDGVCRMWDQDANGYGRGDGVAAIVLKTLKEALADGDHIECVIRETGVNQDGNTPGITIPSASAQTALIHQTYAKTGLEPLLRLDDRPQYFEAHGTGTQVGDPIEARAIHDAFFSASKGINPLHRNTTVVDDSHPLYVGSIKTILGHTEGTAGLAGIIKASLALQNSAIPPNLHFHRISDRVAPFYPKLEIPRGEVKPWPAHPGMNQQCRRASVNSFGFGGTNAHAILENFDDSSSPSLSELSSLFTPLVFSAGSQPSLRDNLRAYEEFLVHNPTVNIHDLAWTLRQRRSLLAHRVYITAQSIEDLRHQIAAMKTEPSLGYRFNARFSETKENLGNFWAIFTGQGAQFARVGAELVERSPYALRIIQSLEDYLAALSPNDRPTWSLKREILASGDTSRINEASIAQPVCTAVHILLVDLLALAGVRFDVVIGHSSGEIGAAYAAGALSARDAIYIAYFRGLCVAKAASSNGQHIGGAMVAVQTSMDDAVALCQDDLYNGRINVAASNSSSSVTISGDVDAIEELEELLRDENKGFRRLRVDTAYHSRHMDNCHVPYVKSLRRYGVKVVKSTHKPASQAPRWFSTVYNKLINLDDDDGLNDTYWAENMTRPVLFSQALQTSLLQANDALPSVIIEVGPHPVLQGPASQTMQESLQKTIPYHGTLVRGINAVTALSNTLGFLWQRFHNGHSQTLSLDHYERALATAGDGKDTRHRFHLLSDLPTYQWNYTTLHWTESRASRLLRLRPEPYHPLLGHFTADSHPRHLRWRNILRLAQLGADDDYRMSNWMEGHCIEGQTVIPAAGYVSTAIEAARALPQAATALTSGSLREADKLHIRLIEIHNLVIHRAVSLTPENGDGVEVLIELIDITLVYSETRVRSRFTYSTALGQRNDALTLVASAELEVLLGTDQPDLDLLPTPLGTNSHMTGVDSKLFYASIDNLGYNYYGRYRSLASLRRKHGRATSLVAVEASESGTPLLMFPADLDATFQTLLLAFSYPEDSQMRTLHLPTRLGHIRVNLAQCEKIYESSRRNSAIEIGKGGILAVEATVTKFCQKGLKLSERGGFVGDLTIFNSDSSHAAIQVQDVEVVPLGNVDGEHNDRKIFTRMQWIGMEYDGEAAAAPDQEIVDGPRATATRDTLERLAIFYLRQFNAQVPHDSPLRSDTNEDPLSYYLRYARHIVFSLEPARLQDVLVDIQKAAEPISALPDVEIMTLVGESIPRIVRGETTMLERFRETSALHRFYEEGFAMAPSARWQARVMKQLTDRNPHMDIIEVGAGTGSTTKPILQNIDRSFRSYTFTDVSAGFFGTANATLSSLQDRVSFKTLDLESSPCTQGFVAGAYDVVVASFVLHATASLKRTLRHVRSLLRPGGFLVVGECGMNSPLLNFIFGPLPGWWLGHGDEGRMLSPAVPAEQWNRLLLETGFSGIDTRSPVSWDHTLGVFLFASQAIDDQVRLLRDPISLGIPPSQQLQSLVLIGGETDRTKPLVRELERIFQQLNTKVYNFQSLGDFNYRSIPSDDSGPAPVLSLVDLDRPVMEYMAKDSFEAFRHVFQTARTLLWVTSGRLAENPFSNMVVGFGRTAIQENVGLFLQHLDLETPFGQGAPKIISETFIRLILNSNPNPTKEEGKGGILWTLEPEIVANADGCYQVPRLMPISELNLRYNSGRRCIVKKVPIAQVPVSIQCDHDGTITLEKLPPAVYSASGYHKSSTARPLTELRVTRAVLPAVKTPLGHMFLVSGIETCTETRYLALVPSLASIMNVHTNYMVPIPPSSVQEEILLSLAANKLVAMAVMDRLVPGKIVLIHNARPGIAEAFRIEAAKKGITVVFTVDGNMTQNTMVGVGLETISLRPYLSQAQLWQLLPAKADISCFVSLASGNSQVKNQDIIMEDLPEWCRRETAESLFSWTKCDPTLVLDSKAPVILQQVLDYAQKHNTSKVEVKVISLERLVTEESATFSKYAAEAISFVADLTTPALLPARTLRLDVDRHILKSNRTYWVVGLSGTLGVSLCDWMVKQGAQYLVISSRSPAIESAWIEACSRKGAIVTIMPCDVTNYAALSAVYAEICHKHPPIAGVFNGAMVLRDAIINNMTFSQIREVLGPKVTGSLHLDRLFSSPQSPLDFFILLSSVNYIIGNPGQANYAAANAFQCALAARRKQRGLPGLALNIGAIIGAGYLHRTGKRKLDITVARGGLMHLSEEDFHQIIAEGILLESARRDGNYTDTELTTGLLSVASDVTDRPIWFMDPKFFHLILAYDKQVDDFDQGSITDGNTGANAKLMTISAVRDRLHSSRTPREVDTIVTEAFATLLRYELQIKSTSDDDLMQMHSDELGVDSLVAVDIRNWFLKSLCVSIPVLRIMGKGNMTSLVQHAIENIPSEMIPQVAWESLKPHENEKQEASRDTATYRTVYNHNTNSQSTIPLDVPGTFIDWAAETQPPTTSDDLLELLQSHSTYTEAAVFPPKVIVITGSTGLLGGHLLSYLLQVSLPTTKIIGISVRRLRTIDIHTFLAGLPLDIRAAAASGRVSFLAGDLSQPRLGLSPADCAASFAAADVVIHAGADTSHIKPYADLRETNVGSVAELVRLCAVRKGVSLHFVSSAGVGLFSANDESDQMLPERAPGTPPAADGEGILAHSGYLASKWAGERLLERAASAGKLHVWIHRPSTIVRQGIDAREDQARFDWLNQLVLYVCATRTIPEVKHARGALDLVYVDNVCEEIAKHALQCPRAGIPIISYVHEVGDIVVPLDRLEDLLEVDLKIDTVNGPLDEEQANPKLSVRDNPSDTSFVRLSMSRWIEMAVGRGLHPAVAALIEAMDRPDTPIFLRIKKGNSSNPNGLSEPEGT